MVTGTEVFHRRTLLPFEDLEVCNSSFLVRPSSLGPSDPHFVDVLPPVDTKKKGKKVSIVCGIRGEINRREEGRKETVSSSSVNSLDGVR